ncbi:MAG TPA: MFS transporter [Terriglobia bacterium]|nr:MFS transporter [Terriglobia bacterium]
MPSPEIATTNSEESSFIRLGLKANWQQFGLLVLVNAFVGGMVGLERTILPLIAETTFGMASRTAILSFLISFGLTKAFANLLAGRWSDRIGRKPILILGWICGLPVPWLLIHAPSWDWVVFANVLLGINQGACWSTTVIMKIDLVGPRQRGFAMGLNEFAGYLAVAASAWFTSYLAAGYGPRPVPFYLGVVFSGLGLLLSVFAIKETRLHAERESQLARGIKRSDVVSFRQIFLFTSWKNRSLFAASQAGLVNNLNDGMMWGLLPLFLTERGLPFQELGIVAAIYPGVWGTTQLLTGALSDRWGRKRLIAWGMWIQGGAIGMLVLWQGFWPWMTSSALLGVGTALVYPTLLAAVSDLSNPAWRASSVGVYRLWRDSGYALGGLMSGVLADAFSAPTAIFAIAGLTFFSGVVVASIMAESRPSFTDSSAAVYSRRHFKRVKE